MQKRIMAGKTEEERLQLTERQRRIYDFLRENYTGVLATVDTRNNPHVVVIYYCIDQRFAISFLTKTGTKKYENLAHNNRVILIVFESTSQTVAQVIGKVSEITDAGAVNDIASAVFENVLDGGDKGDMPLTKLDAGEYTAFRIDPEQIRISSYRRSGEAGNEPVCESIESFDLNL